MIQIAPCSVRVFWIIWILALLLNRVKRIKAGKAIGDRFMEDSAWRWLDLGLPAVLEPRYNYVQSALPILLCVIYEWNFGSVWLNYIFNLIAQPIGRWVIVLICSHVINNITVNFFHSLCTFILIQLAYRFIATLRRTFFILYAACLYLFQL